MPPNNLLTRPTTLKLNILFTNLAIILTTKQRIVSKIIETGIDIHFAMTGVKKESEIKLDIGKLTVRAIKIANTKPTTSTKLRTNPFLAASKVIITIKKTIVKSIIKDIKSIFLFNLS